MKRISRFVAAVIGVLGICSLSMLLTDSGMDDGILMSLIMMLVATCVCFFGVICRKKLNSVQC